jgi:hypothetical protein
MLFKVRQEIALQGSTTDAEDDSGGEPETTPTLEREVLQHQDGNHALPYFSGPARAGRHGARAGGLVLN